MRRWAATALLAVLTGTTLTATLHANTDDPPRLRQHGIGQIRFKGHGPEWWALEAHRLDQAHRGEQRLNHHLQRLLASRLSELVWLVQAFTCIHEHEGAWDDPNAPYYGGLQMDWNFMRAYGRRLLYAKGTADHWTPAEQMTVAIVAYQTRGFWPWPNTARMCGLL
jgi:hypothetical protein